MVGDKLKGRGRVGEGGGFLKVMKTKVRGERDR